MIGLTLCMLLSGYYETVAAAPIEVGIVAWGRDFERALVESKKSNKPILILFQEVPGCSGCQKFGRNVLSHPQIVEAIESEFVPVLVHNNKGGKDAELLKRFGEPAWNYQVIRFLDESGKDLIPRKDKIWTVESVAARMAKALEKAGRKVPLYLKALAGTTAANSPGLAAFAMFCFWTGEYRLGGLPGVLTTEAGWIEGREVTLVNFDREQISFATLLNAAVKFDCAKKVFTSHAKDTQVASRSRLDVGALPGSYRIARTSDQKRQLNGTNYQKMKLSPVQATKVNAFVRTNPNMALSWLSPRQQKQL